MERNPSHKMVRELPKDAKIVKTINGIDLYNINTLQNIMSWTAHCKDVPAFEYFGTQITYGELPGLVDTYAKGFTALGINAESVVTMSLPVTIEYYASLFAVLNMGAISNNVNFLFLRNDLPRYTLEKNSDVLITLDVYLPLIAEQLKETGIRTIILTSLNDYLPPEKAGMFNDYSKLPKKVRETLNDKHKMRKADREIAALKNVRLIYMRDVLKIGEEYQGELVYPPVDITRDSIYSYTSGTTGIPKCIVFTEQSPNAIIEMHNGLDLRDFVGDRSLVVIPPSHATGMFYGTYLQLAKGKTLVLQPIYEKETFAEDLREFNINHTLAAASFYLEAVKQNNIKPGEYKNLSRPCSGGEPITLANVLLINDWLRHAGCPEKVAIGGGSGEVGSSALTSYELDSETKTNETGLPIPGVYVKILDPETGEPVQQGRRGLIYISSAAAADRYLKNKKATAEYFQYDENGIRWANLDDIAVQNPNGSYSILGRRSDSYVDEEGVTHYLFDIEYSLEINDPVLEWEITAFATGGGHYDVVAQVVLKPESLGEENETIRYLCHKYRLDGVKIYEAFETSEVTGKRNYKLLKSDYEGYYSPCNDDELNLKTYSADGNVKKQVVRNDEVKIQKKA